MRIILEHLYQVEPLHAAMFVLAMNLLTFPLYGIDKRLAIKKGYRIPETSLLLVALLGGSPAAMLAQRVFKHKISKQTFRRRIWIITIFQVAALAYLWYIGFLELWALGPK